jgi:DNA ligase (NAD+)
LLVQGELFWRLTGHVQAKVGSLNARSTVAGLMARKELAPEQGAGIGLFIWDWPQGPASLPARVALLDELGLPGTVPYSQPIQTFADAEHWRDHWYRSPLPFASDLEIPLCPGAGRGAKSRFQGRSHRTDHTGAGAETGDTR